MRKTCVFSCDSRDDKDKQGRIFKVVNFKRAESGIENKSRICTFQIDRWDGQTFSFKEENKEIWRTSRGQTATEVRFQSAIKIAE